MKYIRLTSLALALLAAGCSTQPGTPALPAAVLPASVPGSRSDKPLDYRLSIENRLGDTLTVIVTPGKESTLTGSPSFSLKPGERETVSLTIPAYQPGTIATVAAHNATSSQQALNTISLAATNQGVLQIYSIDVFGMDETTTSTVTAEYAAVKIVATNLRGLRRTTSRHA